MACAVAAKMGINSVAVAVLEVNSVINETASVSTSINNHSGHSPSTVNDSPINVPRPLAMTPLARQMPPANNNKIPHGISFASDQSSKRVVAFLLLE